MLPAAEIASNVPDAVRVFGEGPKTYVDGLSWGWKIAFSRGLTFAKNKAKTSDEFTNSSVEQAANWVFINNGLV